MPSVRSKKARASDGDGPDIRALAQDYGERAIAALSDLMLNAQSETARIAAANALLDRAYGKVRVDGGVSGVVNVTIDVSFD